MNSKIKVLIADDEDRIRKLVSDLLIKEGYDIEEASNGKQALEFINGTDKLDLVILDLMMPEMDGWQVLSEVRKTSDIPVILLTAKSTEGDELSGFRMGADDYIKKPFSLSLLVARVQAVLRRRGKLGDKGMRCGSVYVDELAHMVYLDDVSIDLTPKEYDLLVFFMQNKGVALSRERMLNGVWNYDYFGDLRTVDTHVKQLRSKLGAAGDMIVTVRGIGYRFEVK